MSNIRVLLVDDDPFTLRTVECALADEEDVEIVGQTEDGDTAIEMARRLRPDVVVTDIKHPGLDGYALTRALTEQIDGVKVVVLSGYSWPTYFERCRLAAATGFVVKPEPMSVLTSAIKTVAGGGEFWSPALVHALRLMSEARTRRRPTPDR